MRRGTEGRVAMGSRMTRSVLAALAALLVAMPGAASAQDPAEGQYTESAPTFQPTEPDPAPAPDPDPAPSPAPTTSQPSAPSTAPTTSSATPSTTATTTAEQLPVTGADPRVGLAALALLALGLGLRRRTAS